MLPSGVSNLPPNPPNPEAVGDAAAAKPPPVDWLAKPPNPPEGFAAKLPKAPAVGALPNAGPAATPGRKRNSGMSEAL